MIMVPINFVLYNIITTNGVVGAGVFYQLICLNLFVFCIIRGMGEETIFNPFFGFSISPLSLAIYMPSVSSYYMNKLDISTYRLLIYNFIMFTIGVTINLAANENRCIKKHKRWPFVPHDRDNVFWSKVFIWISLVPVLIAIVTGVSGGWNNIKTAYAGIPLSGITNMLVFAGLLFAFKSKRKNAIWFAIIAVVITAVALLTKTSVMFAIIIIIGAFDKYYNTRKFKRWQYALFIVAIILFALADSAYTDIRGAQIYVQATIDRSDTSFIPASMVNSYLYFVMPWSNTQYVCQYDSAPTFGLWTLKTFLGYFGLDNNFMQYYELAHPTSFNTFGYVVYFLKDFGFIGSGIASLILGILMKKLYAAYKTSSSPFVAVAYLFNFRAIMMMFFNNHWCTSAYPITIVVLMWISSVVYKYLPNSEYLYD